MFSISYCIILYYIILHNLNFIKTVLFQRDEVLYCIPTASKDFLVVLISVIELVVEFFVDLVATEVDTSNLRVMRFVRIARTLRGVRVIRLLRYIGSLRTIVTRRRMWIVMLT